VTETRRPRGPNQVKVLWVLSTGREGIRAAAGKAKRLARLRRAKAFHVQETALKKRGDRRGVRLPYWLPSIERFSRQRDAPSSPETRLKVGSIVTTRTIEPSRTSPVANNKHGCHATASPGAVAKLGTCGRPSFGTF
jgi:hypothetical protein